MSWVIATFDSLKHAHAATNSRLMSARTKMILAISTMLRKEGILYTMPPMAQHESGGGGTSVHDGGGQSDMGLVGQVGVYNIMPQVTNMST